MFSTYFQYYAIISCVLVLIFFCWGLYYDITSGPDEKLGHIILPSPAHTGSVWIPSTGWMFMFFLLPIINVFTLIYFVGCFLKGIVWDKWIRGKEDPNTTKEPAPLNVDALLYRIVCGIVKLGNGREDIYVSSYAPEEVVLTDDMTNINRPPINFPREYYVERHDGKVNFIATLAGLNATRSLLTVNFNEINEVRQYCSRTFGLYDPHMDGDTDINPEFTLIQQVYDYITDGAKPRRPQQMKTTEGKE